MRERQLSIFDFENEPSFILQNEIFPDSESYETEYKSALNGLPKDLWKTYSAFANSQGGIIALGISEKNGNFKIEGLADDHIQKLQRDFWNLLNDRKAISKNILENKDVRVCIIDKKQVLAINVPIASRTQKPIFLTQNPFNNTYKRNHEGDYHCTDEEVRRMLADADLNFQPDGRILEYHTLDDFDPTSIRQYRQLFSSSKPDHNWLTLPDKEFLIQLGAYKIDRKTKKEGPTVAGMLMLGKTISINDADCCPYFFPDYREYLSENPEDRWTDRIYSDGTWEANLFQFYRLVWPKLSSRLPKPFHLHQGRRIDETPAHEALREAFVNSLVHADYSATGNLVIESRLDTFLFTNPGTLLVTLDQYYLGGISECRNLSLQKMFMMIGSAEKAGSGVGKILAGWSNAHWRRPYLFEELRPDRLVLQLHMLSTIHEDTITELKTLFGEQVDHLGKDDLMILATCQIEGDITNQRLQYLIDRHKTEITKLLQELCKRQLLISDNKGRWSTYHLNKDYKSGVDTLNENNLNQDSTNQDSSNLDSSNLDSSNLDSSNLDSSNLDSSNLDSSNLDSSNLDSSNLDSLNLDSTSTSYKSASKKLSFDEIVVIIKDFCSNEYKSIDQIAEKVGRNVKYLKNDIIPRIVKNGELMREYPENHPNQRFKTAK